MLKQYDKATADLDESAKVDTDNPDLYLWRANVDFAADGEVGVDRRGMWIEECGSQSNPAATLGIGR